MNNVRSIMLEAEIRFCWQRVLYWRRRERKLHRDSLRPAYSQSQYIDRKLTEWSDRVTAMLYRQRSAV